MLVKELIEMLKDMPEDAVIAREEYVNCWSGNPDDTDLSYYKLVPADEVVLDKIFKPWELNDPRLKDKRRTIRGDYTQVVAIK